MKRIGITSICFILTWCGLSSELRGDISLPKIFSDHMVLQCNTTVKIWGDADAGQKLTVKFAGVESKTTASVKGDWAVSITTPEAGGPYELEVVADEGEPKVIFSDVMVGEVWLCSGQCNMGWEVSKSLNAQTEIELSKNFPMLRLFKVGEGASPQPLEDFAKVEPWNVCTPESVKDFSGTAYFFGRELSKELEGTPIGLIDASWAGTVCEAWTSRKSMDDVAALAPLLKHWDESDDPTSPNRPGNLYNGMIAPLKNFPIRGTIWYQGEANHGRGQQYATLFPTLIKDWRESFGVGDFPFYFVQLAPFRYNQKPPEALAEIWDAQLKTLKSVPNTQMVVTTDIGNLEDINPINKQKVGSRLALIALADVYKSQLAENRQNIVYSGPIYESMSTNGNRIRITFKHARGLRTRSGETEITYFSICGEDKQFVPATARIEGETIEVSSEEVDNPIAVRFAWDDSAQPNLVNEQGLPASPFRTDEFPLISEGREF
jgi:sialate O-acetylesterase